MNLPFVGSVVFSHEMTSNRAWRWRVWHRGDDEREEEEMTKGAKRRIRARGSGEYGWEWVENTGENEWRKQARGSGGYEREWVENTGESSVRRRKFPRSENGVLPYSVPLQSRTSLPLWALRRKAHEGSAVMLMSPTTVRNREGIKMWKNDCW